MKKRTTRVAGCFVLAVALTSCGGSGSNADADDKELADAITASLNEDDAFGSEADTECMGEGFVKGIGGASGANDAGLIATNLEESSLEQLALSQTQAESIVDNIWTCDGVKRALLTSAASDATDDEVSCLIEGTEDGPLRGVFASSFMGEDGTDLMAESTQALTENFIETALDCGIS